MRAIVCQRISKGNNLSDGVSARTAQRQEERNSEVWLHTTAAPVPSGEQGRRMSAHKGSSMTYLVLLGLYTSVTEDDVQGNLNEAVDQQVKDHLRGHYAQATMYVPPELLKSMVRRLLLQLQPSSPAVAQRPQCDISSIHLS